ncbi:unnamed protein product, partial [marine sediment metagenome]
MPGALIPKSILIFYYTMMPEDSEFLIKFFIIGQNHAALAGGD